jgi:hypothetical protein
MGYYDYATVASAAVDVMTTYTKLPLNLKDAIVFGVSLMADKTSIVVAISAPDSDAKAYTGLALSAMGLGAALMSSSLVSAFASGYGLGTAIASAPIAGRTVDNWLGGGFYDGVQGARRFINIEPCGGRNR